MQRCRDDGALVLDGREIGVGIVTGRARNHARGGDRHDAVLRFREVQKRAGGS